MDIIVIFKYGNEAAFINRCDSLGIPEHGNAANMHKQRRRFKFMGYPTANIHGDTYQRTRMAADDAAKFPSNDQNPAFAIVWRSDDLVGGELKPEPKVEVDSFDLDGNLDGTRLQGVGTF